MSCPANDPNVGSCSGCIACEPTMYDVAQDIYQGPGVTGGDTDPVPQGRNDHPH